MMMATTTIPDEDLHLLVAYIRDGRWESVGTTISRMDHDTAFSILSILSDEALNRIQVVTDFMVRDRVLRFGQMTYLRVAAVTILRGRDAYGGKIESHIPATEAIVEKLRTGLAGTGIVREP